MMTVIRASHWLAWIWVGVCVCVCYRGSETEIVRKIQLLNGLQILKNATLWANRDHRLNFIQLSITLNPQFKTMKPFNLPVLKISLWWYNITSNTPTSLCVGVKVNISPPRNSLCPSFSIIWPGYWIEPAAVIIKTVLLILSIFSAQYSLYNCGRVMLYNPTIWCHQVDDGFRFEYELC